MAHVHKGALFALVLALIAFGCTGGGEYQRGSTAYSPGKATVSDPNIKKVNQASFDGIRVRGPDSDVEPEYWDRLLALHPPRYVFERFRQRFNDLRVYQSGAEDAALASFRQFCKQRNLAADFDSFWE